MGPHDFISFDISTVECMPDFLLIWLFCCDCKLNVFHQRVVVDSFLQIVLKSCPFNQSWSIASSARPSSNIDVFSSGALAFLDLRLPVDGSVDDGGGCITDKAAVTQNFQPRGNLSSWW